VKGADEKCRQNLGHEKGNNSISDAMELLIAHIVQNTLRVMRQHRPVEVSDCSPS
jgi:hypothetical protein